MLKEVNSECILLSPLVNGRKGHHKPIVNWAFEKGFEEVRCDGVFYSTENFPGLDRYRIHDVEAVIVRWSKFPPRLKSDLLFSMHWTLEMDDA